MISLVAVKYIIFPLGEFFILFPFIKVQLNAHVLFSFSHTGFLFVEDLIIECAITSRPVS